MHCSGAGRGHPGATKKTQPFRRHKPCIKALAPHQGRIGHPGGTPESRIPICHGFLCLQDTPRPIAKSALVRVVGSQDEPAFECSKNAVGMYQRKHDIIHVSLPSPLALQRNKHAQNNCERCKGKSAGGTFCAVFPLMVPVVLQQCDRTCVVNTHPAKWRAREADVGPLAELAEREHTRRPLEAATWFQP
eukprot:gene8049-biopygen15130